MFRWKQHTHSCITKGGGKGGEIQNSIILRKFGPENTHNQIQNTAQPARTHAAVAGRGEIQSDFQIKRSEIPGGHMARRQIRKKFNQNAESDGRQIGEDTYPICLRIPQMHSVTKHCGIGYALVCTFRDFEGP